MILQISYICQEIEFIQNIEKQNAVKTGFFKFIFKDGMIISKIYMKPLLHKQTQVCKHVNNAFFNTLNIIV